MTTPLRGLLLALALTLPLCVQAAEIFQWRDKSGRLHFTDDPGKVPAARRQSSERDVRPVRSVGRGVSPATGAAGGAPDGAALWRHKCAACHFEGFGRREDRTGLGEFTVDEETRMFTSAPDVRRRLQRFIDLSDMPSVEVSEAEMLEIARYLLESQSREGR